MSVANDSILVVPDGEGQCVVGKINQVCWSQILTCYTCCMWGACWWLGSCLRSCHDLREYLVPSLSLQLRNQGQESSQDLTMVALHPGNFVTKLGLELGQVGVVSEPLMSCVIAVRSYPALEWRCYFVGLQAWVGQVESGLQLLWGLPWTAWRRGWFFPLTSSWSEGLESFVWPPGTSSQLMPRSVGTQVWGAAVGRQRGPKLKTEPDLFGYAVYQQSH